MGLVFSRDFNIIFLIIVDGLSYKQKKALKDKASAGSSHNWNSLFIGHNAVAAVIADQYGTSKEAVLDGRAKGSAAVRLALGETQVVTETKEYLEENGVHLDAFNLVRKYIFYSKINFNNLVKKLSKCEKHCLHIDKSLPIRKPVTFLKCPFLQG